MAGQLKNLPDEQKEATLDWIESLIEHPEYGRELKRVVKKADPRVNFPELVLEDTINAKTKEQEEKLEKFISEQKDKENKSYWEGERRKAKDAGFIKDEEQSDFEKWMIDEHLGNYQRAARMWHDEKHASAAPTNYQDIVGMQLPVGEGLFANPTKFARDESMRFINERNRRSNQ